MGRTRTRTAAGIVLDAGALIALDRGDKRMIALLQRALTQGRAFRVPAGVVGQVWRDGRVQVTLSRFLRSEAVEVIPLDEQLARTCVLPTDANPGGVAQAPCTDGYRAAV